ncbi:MAG TPA: hypothetical protein VK607_24550 [Kofleriaceae bacterium]|nr:hypothetical protein [Kofleriaceae bacterium]HMG53312.1 hypothetical protein [Kofleriaceae bacterium]
MANDKSGSGEPGDDRDVYKTGRAAPIAERAHRNMTELMVGVSSAMAEAARTFSDTLRDRAQREVSRPTDVVEAGALSASRMFAALAESWQGFYDNLVRDHRAAPAEPIDYERLAELVAQKLKASGPAGEPKP